MLKIGFYLMGEKGLSTLQAMKQFSKSNQDCQVSFVISSRDKSVVKDFFDEIKSEALSNQIPFFQRTEMPEGLDADLTFAISWRWMIKNTENLIVFHDSILPKYRGFNPLVTALIEGDREIGVTAIRANKEFDKGNILGIQKQSISYPIKIKDAIEQVSELYAKLVVDVILLKINGNRTEIIQNESDATYSLWRDEEDYQIDWNQPAGKIARFIDAVGYPYNGAICNIDSQKIRIDDAVCVSDYKIVNRTPGKLLMIKDNMPLVVCGSGMLQIVSARNHQNEKYEFNKLRIRLK